MERREACKGGKDAGKKSAPPQSARGNTVTTKPHTARRGDAPPAHSTGPPAKTANKSAPAVDVTAYDQQVPKLHNTYQIYTRIRVLS